MPAARSLFVMPSITKPPSIAVFVFFMAVALLSLTGCGQEEKKESSPEPHQTPRNEYTSGSILEEVLLQVKDNPDDPAVLYHLADLYDRNGKYQQAVETFQKVVALQPDKGYAYLKMGTAYSRMNQPEKAVESLTLAVKYLPKLAMAYNNLGIAYGKMDKLDEKIDALQKALQIRPQYATARYNLALTYLKKGNQEEARKQYETLLEFDTGTARELLKKIENNQQ